MADALSIARHGLRDIAVPGRYGVAEGEAGVAASLIWPLSMVLVTARHGRGEECLSQLADAARLDARLLLPRRLASGNGLDIAWAGPGRWLVLSTTVVRLEQEMATACGETAAVVDLSDARLLLRLRGRKALACLAKGIGIDLHPRVFRPGDTALVWVSHLQAQLSRRDDGDTYDLIGPRAAAGDLWHWLAASAGEFGLVLDAPT